MASPIEITATPSPAQSSSNNLSLGIEALLSSIAQIHGSPGNAMGRSTLTNSVSTAMGASTPGLLVGNMSDLAMCSLGSEESILSESISILPPEEIASAACPDCVWSEDSDRAAPRLPAASGVTWAVADVEGCASVQLVSGDRATLVAAEAPFTLYMGTMVSSTQTTADLTRPAADAAAATNSAVPPPDRAGVTSPLSDSQTACWVYSTALTLSTAVTLNPVDTPVPCMAWPSLALELRGPRRVAFVYPMGQEWRHSAYIDSNGRSSRIYDSKTVRKIAQHVSTALACLHEQGLSHGAVRPETVAVMAAARSAKLIFIPNVDAAPRDTDHFFTPPERRRVKMPSTPASDGWALGVTLYALLFGKVPFASGKHEELLRLDFPSEGTTGKLRRWRPLLTALLLPDPEERLTPSDVSAGALNRLM